MYWTSRNHYFSFCVVLSTMQKVLHVQHITHLHTPTTKNSILLVWQVPETTTVTQGYLIDVQASLYGGV